MVIFSVCAFFVETTKYNSSSTACNIKINININHNYTSNKHNNKLHLTNQIPLHRKKVPWQDLFIWGGIHSCQLYSMCTPFFGHSKSSGRKILQQVENSLDVISPKNLNGTRSPQRWLEKTVWGIPPLTFATSCISWILMSPISQIGCVSKWVTHTTKIHFY